MKSGNVICNKWEFGSLEHHRTGLFHCTSTALMDCDSGTACFRPRLQHEFEASSIVMDHFCLGRGDD